MAHERRRSKATPPAGEAPVVEAVTVPADAVAPPAEVVETPVDATDVQAAVGAEAGQTDAAAAPTEQTRLFSIPPPKPADSNTARDDADGESWLALLDDRSSDPAICPFLRAVVGAGIGRPVEAPDAANRCAALREPVPQSLRQQELVCLTSGHVNCPRYLRGAVVVGEVPPPVVTSGRTRLTPAVFGAIVLLLGAFALSIGFVASRGGMEVASIASASPPILAAASATPDPSTAAVLPSAAASPATVAPTSSPSPTPSPAPTSSPTPSPSPSPTVSPSPTPSPTPSAKPRSNRYALLTACARTANCWIYRVRSGDNLYSIARYFGVPIARVYAMNPWLKTTGLKSGQSLRLPPPTR